MSAYIVIATPMTDRECLLAALRDVGLDAKNIEIHDTAVPLVGFEGTQREQVANLVIRRQFVGASSNDVGFLATPTGYRMIVSDYDRPRFGADWQAKLAERYKAHADRKLAALVEVTERQKIEEERARLVEAQRQAIQEKAKKLGYRVVETREGENLRLVLVRRTY